MTTRKSNAAGGAPSGDTRIDDYIAKLDSPLREVAIAARQVIDASLGDLHGTVWHGHPVWSATEDPGTHPVCLLKAYPSYVTLGLWNGQAVADPSGRLQAGTRQMATVKLRPVDDVDHVLFGDWLRQARALAGAPAEH
jgi:hypothetical protein